jgi:hypothetical protein
MTMKRSTRLSLSGAAAGLVLLAAAGAVALLILRDQEQEPTIIRRSAAIPPDPRLLYSGPFQNIHPGVAYVGNEKCAECHFRISRTYAKHPMGRALIPIAELAATQQYDSAHHNPFEIFGCELSVVQRGERVFHRQTWRDQHGKPIFQVDAEVHYAIGSGNHGHSFLSNRDGYLFQTPISWFSKKKIWDVSPGFSVGQLAGRAIPHGCLFCHANRSDPWEGSVNRFKPPVVIGHAIGCERCHGPGEKHVANPGSWTRLGKEEAAGLHLGGNVKKVDLTIVNPAKLTAELRESVCQQCHLEGEARVLPRGRGLYDFRPGLPLESCWAIFVHARGSGDDKKAVNHVEQMYQSGCFQRSRADHKLGCISCHDPHVQPGPDERVQYYRTRCLSCHGDGAGTGAEAACALPPSKRRLRSKQDSCVDCHMPPYGSSDIAHNASTDHRILRGGAGAAETASPWHEPRTVFALSHFQRGPVNPADKALGRDLGVALVQDVAGALTNSRQAEQAVALLENAIARDPDDLVAWESKAKAFFILKRRSEGLAAAEAVLAKVPDHEIALLVAGMLSQDLLAQDPGLLEKCLGYWRRVAAVNPWTASYRASLSGLLAQHGSWHEAGVHCQEWLRLQPGSIDGRKLWIECLLRTHVPERARAELRRLEALQPSEREQLGAWFSKLAASAAARPPTAVPGNRLGE